MTYNPLPPLYMLAWRGRRSEFHTFARIIDNLGGITLAIRQRRGERSFALEFEADAIAIARIRAVFAHTAIHVLV
jgi:hypothetical protein